MSFPIPPVVADALAAALAKLPMAIVDDVIDLVHKIASSPDPKDALARAAQVLAHETAADAAIDGLFEAKKRVPGSGL